LRPVGQIQTGLPQASDVYVRGEAPVFEELLFAGHTLTGHDLLAAIKASAADLG
jgi:hypothetical protein